MSDTIENNEDELVEGTVVSENENNDVEDTNNNSEDEGKDSSANGNDQMNNDNNIEDEDADLIDNNDDEDVDADLMDNNNNEENIDDNDDNQTNNDDNQTNNDDDQTNNDDDQTNNDDNQANYNNYQVNNNNDNNQNSPQVGQKRTFENMEEGNEEHIKKLKETDYEAIIVVRQLIPTILCGAVIGKGGDKIKQCKKDYQVSMHITSNQAPNRVLSIKGKLSNVKGCLQYTIDVLNEARKTNPKVAYHQKDSKFLEIDYLIPACQAGSVIGKGGENIKSVKKMYNVKTQVSHQPLPYSTEKQVTMVGEPEMLKLAIQPLVDILVRTKEILKRVPQKAHDPSTMMTAAPYNSYAPMNQQQPMMYQNNPYYYNNASQNKTYNRNNPSTSTNSSNQYFQQQQPPSQQYMSSPYMGMYGSQSYGQSYTPPAQQYIDPYTLQNVMASLQVRRTVSENNGQIQYTFNLPLYNVAAVIGRHGSILDEIKRASGVVDLKVNPQLPNQDFREVNIIGNDQANNVALMKINDIMNKGSYQNQNSQQLQQQPPSTGNQLVP